MSEETVVVTAAPAQSEGLTAGMLLRQAREATGLHVAALAVAMKVPVKKLEALEADRLDQLPDAVFVRALAASVCRTLKVDPALVLSRLPQTVTPKFDHNDRGINMPYSDSGIQYANSFKAFISRPAVLLVSALLLAALVVVFYPESHSGDQHAAVAVSASSTTSPTPIPMLASAASSVNPVLPSVAPTPAVVSGSATIVSGLPSAAMASEPRSAASDIVIFKATASAWVRVSDSKGVVQFEKTLSAGESGAVSGALPLSVVLGNVSATEVQVRGQPFALGEIAKNNVARFEVK